MAPQATETGGKVLWVLSAEWHLQSLIARLALTGIPTRTPRGWAARMARRRTMSDA
jgi:hypothetical protein